MSKTDGRGLPVSQASERSIDRFEEALTLLHGYYGDPLSAIDRALADDPNFLMGLAFRAGLLVTSSEKRAVTELRATIERARDVIAAGEGTERERAHIAAAGAWLDGDLAGATDRYNEISLRHPRDALALQLSHLCNFFLGRAVWLRDHVAAVLPHLSPGEPIYGYALGMRAFGLEESNEFDRAEAAGRRALELNPRDPWAIHAVAHCFEMEGRISEGIEWMESRESAWATDSFFAVHNWWHLALYYLDLDDRDRVLALYDRRVRGSSSEVMLDLVDASSFLWRLYVQGIDVGDRWVELADRWAKIDEDGYYAFNDVHALMAYAGAGRRDDVRAALDGLERAARQGGTNAALARRVGLPVARALAAFADGDARTTLELLHPVRLCAHEFGGSNAQRDVLDVTLVEAAFRAKEYALARALVDARVARKPGSVAVYRSLARVFDATNARDRAADARRDAAERSREHRKALDAVREPHAAE